MSEIELLQLLLKATKVGKLSWHEHTYQPADNETKRLQYVAYSGKRIYCIEEQDLLLPDGRDVSGGFYQVIIDGALITFASGTPQERIVDELLAVAFPDMADSLRFIEEGRIEAAAHLMDLIGEEPTV